MCDCASELQLAPTNGSAPSTNSSRSTTWPRFRIDRMPCPTFSQYPPRAKPLACVEISIRTSADSLSSALEIAQSQSRPSAQDEMASLMRSNDRPSIGVAGSDGSSACLSSAARPCQTAPHRVGPRKMAPAARRVSKASTTTNAAWVRSLALLIPTTDRAMCEAPNNRAGWVSSISRTRHDAAMTATM